ncbi:MAG: response regulator [Thermomicrobiales bacterium]
MTTEQRSKIVLLVEDSPSDAFLTTEAIEQCTAEPVVHTVRNGEDALDFLYRRGEFADAPRPDIVVLDLNLPKKSGFEVLEEMNRDPSLEIIPVIILTTSSDQEDIVKSYRLHASSYMTKPVDIQRFSDAIQSFDNFWFSVVDLPIVDD